VGTTIDVGFSSTGTWGSTSVFSSGNASYLYDSTESAYFEMLYDETGGLDGSSWRWVVRGSEILGGAAVGGWLGGWPGGFAGALAGWTLSDIAFEVVEGITKPPPPERPAKPTPPQKLPPVRQETTVNIYNFDGNQGPVNFVTNGNRISGNINVIGNDVRGSIDIPNPAPISLLTIGLFVIVIRFRQTLGVSLVTAMFRILNTKHSSVAVCHPSRTFRRLNGSSGPWVPHIAGLVGDAAQPPASVVY
jgi:hypothetical protein